MINKISFFFFFSLLFFSCKTNDSNLLEINQNDNANNVLLIVVDDMGLDATVGYNVGDQKPSMPIVQDLINTGLKFNNVWSNPVCTPTRSTILTGKYGYNTNVLSVDDALSTSETSLFNHLKEYTNLNMTFYPNVR